MKTNLRHIIIKWSYPRKWDCFEDNPLIDSWGIYYITRAIYYDDRTDETPIYVGKTIRSFRQRFREHEKDEKDFLYKKGEFYVRLGIIEYPNSFATYEKEELGVNRLLLTLESGIITELQNIGYKVQRNLTNVSQISTYTRHYHLEVENIGYRHYIPSLFNNRNH